MDISKLVSEGYDIGNIISITRTKFGSGNTYVIETKDKKFIAKLNNKKSELEIYNRVERELHGSEVNQPAVIKTKSNELITPEGMVLYEYIEGEALEYFDGEMERKALRYMYKYNQLLKQVKFEEDELVVENDWDRIKSLEYIYTEGYQRVKDIDLNQGWKEVLLDSIEALRRHKERLNKLPKQVTHSDLGSDNFLVKDGEICAIIDFSPDINHELYSLAHFTYWNYIWDSRDLEKQAIDNYLNNYCPNSYLKSLQKDFYLLLLRASIFRVLGPMFQISHSEIPDYSSLGRRIDLVKWINKELIS